MFSTNHYYPRRRSDVVLFSAECGCLKPLLFSLLFFIFNWIVIGLQLSRLHAYMSHLIEVCVCVSSVCVITRNLGRYLASA